MRLRQVVHSFIALSTLGASAALGQEFIEDCGLEPVPLDVPPVAPKPYELPFMPGEPPVLRRELPSASKAFGVPNARQREGILTGKTVYLSAGHGFTWTDAVEAWRTQRGNTHDIVEDLVSIETVNQVLIPMLLNAGAVVVGVREPDLNTRMVVVDDLDDSAYTETGPEGTFANSSIAGWGHPPNPMNGTTLPFGLGRNRLMNTASTATARASWTPQIPADGFYNVYVAYTSFSARATDAHFVVHHAGGDAHFRINQRRRGGTWLLLGRFYFRAGSDAARGSVEALNDSASGGNVSLDAVRFGGGQGLIARGPTPRVSGRPRFEESCRYHAQFSGAPSSVFQASSQDRTTDVSCRSRFAAWDHEAGEDAVYVAWHTNASNGNQNGTETYVYGTNTDYQMKFSPCLPNTTTCGVASCPAGCGAPGSDDLARAIHDELVADIREGLGLPGWKDRGVRSANFGELNPNYNPEMPSTLVEVAFHDSAGDAAQLKEPRFRYVAARAIAQGIMRYFAARDATGLSLPPEPPTAVSAVQQGGGAVTVSWLAPPVDNVGGYAATGYRLYQSADGLAWDDGTDVNGTSLTLSLPEGEVRYFRVAGTNLAGESFPSQVVGVRVGSAQQRVLVVNAYQRLDASLGKADDLSGYALAQPVRIFVERMNDGTYVGRHGDAIAYAGVAFDSATADAVVAGQVALTGYPLVDWFLGRGPSNGGPLSAAEQQLLRAHVEAGRNLLFSGTQAVSALASGTPSDQSFLSQVLRVSKETGAGTLAVEGDGVQLLAGIPILQLDDGTLGSFDTGPADVLGLSGGVGIARYAGSSSWAATAFSGGPKVVVLGFPFETIHGLSPRYQVMGKFLRHFELIADEPPPLDGGTAAEPAPVVLESMESEYPAAQGCGCGTAQGLLPLAVVLLGVLSRRRRPR